MLAVVTFLIILLVLVLVHEWGHFIVARKLGIKVEEFGFGLPPRIWGRKIGETLYSLNLLPFGGFVKLYGEDEAGGGKIQLKVKDRIKAADEKRAFYARPPLEKMKVAIAGVIMNAILSFIIFYIFLGLSGFKTQLPPLREYGAHTFFLVDQSETADILVGTISKNSPAEQAGIQPYSKIESINGQRIKSSASFVEEVNSDKGKKTTLVWIDSKNKTHQAVVVPRVNPPKNEGALGISFYPIESVNLNYDTTFQKVFSGIIHPLNLLVYNFDITGKVIGASFAQKSAAPLEKGVAGPVGIYSLVGSIVQIPNMKERLLELLNLAGLLSILLAFFNILPIPGLDGGRFLFAAIEFVSGRKMNSKVEGYANTIGFALLMSLLIVVTFHDIQRIASGKNIFSP